MGKEGSVTIDFMRKEDIDQVFEIEQASFTMPWSRNLFLSEFRSPGVSTLMVALDDAPVRTVTGYLIFWLVADEMHILNLAVAPRFRRRGIAGRLIRSALGYAYAKGSRRAFLEVRASNEAARKLYGGIGFTGTQLRREYYDSPVEDAVVMTLEQTAFEDLVRRRDGL